MDVRSDFPMLEGQIYLDTAATALKPKQVLDSLNHFYSKSYATVHRAVYARAQAATEQFQGAREKVRAFLNAASSDEILFTRGTTASLNFVARSFARAFLKAGDVVLISEIEHHSNIVPWQMVREEVGIVLRTIPVTDEGELDLLALAALLTPQVKLVSLSHMSNVLGTIHPVKEVIEKAHAVGAKVCLDGAQAAAHLPVDVQALDVDFYAFSGHKLYGPTGVGVLYGKRHLLEQMPPIEGGGDMIETVTFEKTTYNALPFKFEAGTPMIAEAIGLGAALDYLSGIGMEEVEAYERALLAHATEGLQQFTGVRLIGTAKEKGALITFVQDTLHPLDLATLLDCRGIAIRSGHLCSQPALRRFCCQAAARISFGIYTTHEEIDIFLSTLATLL